MGNEVYLLLERIKQLEEENSILKQQQLDITKAKELYLKIFEEFPALIWRSRLDKLCDYFNKTWLDFTGRTMEQEFGNGWAEGVHPDDQDSCIQTYVTSFDKRQAFLMEYRMKNSFGEYRWIRDFGRPFYDLDNTFLGYIGSCYDITESKNNELKLIDLNTTKDKFFSIIAHDLKSPFNSIIGFSEHLIKLVRNGDYKGIGDFANIILQSSNSAMDLLKTLMEWANAQTGRMEFKPESFDLDILLKEISFLLNIAAMQKSIILTNSIPANTLVYADKNMISIVLRNLVTNSIKFSNQGGKINISIKSSPKEFIISVSDNGIGISKERLTTLFNLDASHSTQGTQKEKGTGLGLILCKEFIEKHGGKNWVESELMKGTTFYFSLPKPN